MKAAAFEAELRKIGEGHKLSRPTVAPINGGNQPKAQDQVPTPHGRETNNPITADSE